MPLLIQPKPQHVTLQYTLTQEVPAGHWLRLRASDLRALFHGHVESIHINGEMAKLEGRFDHEFMKKSWRAVMGHYAAAMILVHAPLARGSVIRVELRFNAFDPPAPGPSRPASDRPTEERPDPLAGLTYSYTFRSAASAEAKLEDWQVVSESRRVVLTANQPERLECWRLAPDELAVQHFDAYTNPSHPDVKTVSVGGHVHALEPTLRMTRITRDPTTLRVTVRDARGRDAQSTPNPVNLTGQRVFFGELHWHTEESGDGVRPVEDALRSARDELGLHFAGPSDHLCWGNSYGGRYTVEHQRDLCLKHEPPGQFITLPTFELSGPEGHANVIADSWDLLSEIAKETGASASKAPRHRFPLHEIAALWPPGRAIISSADRQGVVAADGRPCWNPFDFRTSAPNEVVRLIEIHQVRGSFEDGTPHRDWLIDCGRCGSSARAALVKGFRLGCVGRPKNVQFQNGKRDWCFSPDADPSDVDPAWNRGLIPRQEFDASWQAVRRVGRHRARRCGTTTLPRRGPRRR